MLRWSLIFLGISILTAVFTMGGSSGTGIETIVFFSSLVIATVSLTLALISVLGHLHERQRPVTPDSDKEDENTLASHLVLSARPR